MKNFKSKLAEKAGFTLVELIVVIAILGILAGVAVPSYTGYVKKANDAAVESQLAAIKTAAEASATLDNETLHSIDVTAAGVVTAKVGTSGSAAGTTFYDSMETFLGLADTTNPTSVTVSELDTLMDNTSYTGGAAWSAGKWSAK